MKFLIDAQLPKRLSVRFQNLGHDCRHTAELPNGNRTTDRELNQLSVSEQLVMVTKATDFVDSFIVVGVPYKLLLVSTGNITNNELERVVFSNLDAIVDGFSDHRFIEIDREALRFHF